MSREAEDVVIRYVDRQVERGDEVKMDANSASLLLGRLRRLEGVLVEVVGDFDRRAASRRGRLLLWLLRRAT